MYTPYEVLKFWLPIISAFGLVIKAYTSGKKNISDFCDRLLSNHLTHIEQATTSTEIETKKTNELLTGQTGKLDVIQSTLAEQQTKNLLVWHGILESLTILKERTRTRKSTPKRKR